MVHADRRDQSEGRKIELKQGDEVYDLVPRQIESKEYFGVRKEGGPRLRFGMQCAVNSKYV